MRTSQKQTIPPITAEQFQILELFRGGTYDRRECWDYIAQYCEGYDPTAKDGELLVEHLELEPVTVQLTKIKGTGFYLLPV